MSQQKKLEQAYIHGITDGQALILQAIRETHGIGPILEQRIMDKAIEIAKQKQG